MSTHEGIKRSLGEELYPKVQEFKPQLAGKITGMLLEMDDDEISVLLNDDNALMNKINEAVAVLRDNRCIGNHQRI